MDDFAGQPGGFENGAQVYANQASPTPTGKAYDVLTHTGTSGTVEAAKYANGQDGIPDIYISSHIYDWSDGRWSGIATGRTAYDFRSGATVQSQTSRTNDSGLAVFEIRMASGLNVTADQLVVSLVSANGTTELYEWAMVTSGGIKDAPFSVDQIARYSALDYLKLEDSTFFSAGGSPTGNFGSGLPLATGKSISQYLSEAPGSARSGGLTAPGWYAIDDFNTTVIDGPEHGVLNPQSGDGFYDDNLDVTGTMLGLHPGSSIDAITIWFGYKDVGLDSNGDGFTATGSSASAFITGLSLGSSSPVGVPEPSLVILLAGFLPWSRRR